MRHLALAAITAFAFGFAPASAGVGTKAPTLVFASMHEEDPNQPYSPDRLADLFLLRGDVVVRRLTQTIFWEEYPVWSPDGRRIAFSKGYPFCHANTCERRANESSIWIRNLNSPTARRLTRAGSDFIDRSPAWSPDGRTIAFARVYCCDFDAKEGVYTIAPSGRNQKRIDARRVSSLDWSPDGSTIAFLSESGRVRLLDLASGDAPRLLITNVRGGKTDIAWSPRGDKLAIAAAAGIYVVATDGGRARRVAKAPGGFPSIGNSVAWSPDGRQLAFSAAAGPYPARSDIFVVGLNGRDLTRLTTNPGLDFDPDWRP